MAEQQAVLDKWFLRQDVINQLIESGEETVEAQLFADRILSIAETEEAEFRSLSDPFDRSVALVLSLVREEDLDAWNIDLSKFLKFFTQRVKNNSTNLDLPACGRLIRLSWEVLHHQAIDLFDRVQRTDEEEEWDEGFDFGWESEYDDEAFLFTNSILQGDADDILPTLFGERIRREEGRPVTLGELLSAFKDAADDAEGLRLREENRIAHQAELKDYLENIGGRMHNEDLEGDIGRCWSALRRSCLESNSNKVPVDNVKAHLRVILEEIFGAVPEGYQDEAKVTSFIAGLFLTHRGFASISQDVAPDGDIFLEDLWPDLDDFQQVKDAIDELDEKQNVESQDEDSGSVQFAKKRAEKMRLIEEAERKEKELEIEEKASLETVAIDASEIDDSFQKHEWLVE
ncbi:MAG: hypothetical protein ISR22_00425 [Candidatus Poseidoniaceae archaeon]|nr:hypothetical protein [Candidatus Poseidoniaceae archaeon]